MFVFIIGNLALPIIAVLNILVWRKSWRIHRFADRHGLVKPRQLVVGHRINLASLPFTIAPALIEGRFFVQHPGWIASYAVAATLSIIGLSYVNSGLRSELRTLEAQAIDK